MFRVILISSLLAMVLAGLLNVVLPVTNKLPDFSDITDDVTDVVKSRMNGLVLKGVGRNVKELIGIQKKLKIINKIAAEQVKRANAKHGNPSAHPVVFEESVDHLGMKNKDEVLDSLLFQGDMFLPEDQLDKMIEDAANELGWGHDVLTKLGVATRSKRQALINPPDDYRWDLPISYYYDVGIPEKTRQVIRETFNFYANQTCLTFQESSTAIPRIQFRNATSACYTIAGFQGNDWYAAPSNQTNCTICQGAGLHPVNFGEWFCREQFAPIAHEIFHVFGVKHHQSRYDRDDYVTLTAALANDSQFIRLTANGSSNYGTMYDYGSNMHYGFPGMTAKDTLYESTMGTNLGPQFGDILLINNHYQCMCAYPAVTCENGGYPNPNGCDTCICTGGFGGTTCSERDPGTEDGGDTLQATASDSCQTLTTYLGNDDNITNVYNQKSWFHIQAPAGKQVQLIFTKAGSTPGMPFTKTYGCKFQGVEVKIRSGEYSRTGFIFCGDNPVLVSNTTNIIPFTSDNNLAILQIYTMKNKFNLEVKYRYVDSTTDPTAFPVSCKP
uniref:Metalloendopeptidase n=1 Tax=Acrobeloides nanus TaxID=290746 RepID=A0A914E3W8_9BILA